MILIQFRELDELDQAVASIEEDGRFVVVPETEELEDKSREETYEDDDKENERMEHENYKVEEQSGNILTDKTNRLNAQKSGEGEEEKVTKLFRFPLGTIKKLVKLDESPRKSPDLRGNFVILWNHTIFYTTKGMRSTLLDGLGILQVVTTILVDFF